MPSIAFADYSIYSAASPFYAQFPAEPIPPEAAGGTVSVDPTVHKLDDRKVETLLRAIVKNVSKGGSVLIVSHGNSQGVFIDLVPPRKLAAKGPMTHIQLEHGPLHALRQNMEGKETDLETAKILMLGDFNKADNAAGIKQLTALKKLVESVQKLELDRVDLRSCNVGENEFALSSLQVFFNCKTCCAPKAYDSFGQIPFGQVTQDPDKWKAWLKEHPGAVIEGTSPNRFALHYKLVDGNSKVMLGAQADSEQAVKDWTKKHLPPGKYSGGPLFYHALTKDLKTLIFAGDPGYREQLAEAYKGKEPSRKVDTKNWTLPRP
jgi:hypothetical protein